MVRLVRFDFNAQFGGIGLSLDGSGILVVEFTRPDRMNAMTPDLKRDLMEVLAQAQMADEVRVVVFWGQKHFSSGDDISGQGPTSSAIKPVLVPRIEHGHRNPVSTWSGLRVHSQSLNTAIRGLGKLTVAAMEGYAVQTGFSLALCCDFRIASRTARMGSATLRFGLLPDEGGHYLLVRSLGLSRALDFILRKRIVSAEHALDLGLVHEVVEPTELHGAALSLARELAAGPQVAMRFVKQSLYNAAELDWHHALDDIASKTAVTDHHPDAAEGVAAFLEKRPPAFNGWLGQSDRKSKL